MDVKKWKPRGPHNKAKVQTRRDRIKAAFKANGMPIFEARNNGAGVRFISNYMLSLIVIVTELSIHKYPFSSVLIKSNIVFIHSVLIKSNIDFNRSVHL